ncbi:MAG: hypothetical protein DRP12_03845 [Candidatus Aenigmatarchaeota archaeon]|nr:MAG: hypothetical protein DRP12_03845 [Candidatus Aenigmarchaeota archaeon]
MGMKNAFQTYLRELWDDVSLGALDAGKDWLRNHFPFLAKIYGFVDGPVDEGKFDELVYIVDKNECLVVPRRYTKKERGVFRKREVFGKPLTTVNQIKFDENGRVEEFEDGEIVKLSFPQLYDPDFDLYGSSKFYRFFDRFDELTGITGEYVKDSMRFVFKYGNPKHVGKDQWGRDVYVYSLMENGRKRKFPANQIFYFLGMSVALGVPIYITNWFRDKLGLRKLEKIGRGEEEPRLLRMYKEWSESINDAIGVPRKIEMGYSI